ncbi:hypothetical protein PVK06_007023 [Gossypium arboreum]|uniref:Bulb-type lectin domain-containing protein n=1 Tax=Gossypium arboreum TaxID=29729 RepID=A0ABR0QGX3_GOSAR|nr:hypothetical protein PVK06_007023 [Gossypium arboreum]
MFETIPATLYLVTLLRSRHILSKSLFCNQTIVSSGGNFVLGFFTPGKSSNYYIGIWYGDKVSEQTPVWVANREIPVRDIYSSELKVSDGNLGLFNESQVPIWSQNISSSNSTSVVAVLEDTGNLLLRDGPNSSTPLRQSFDHPTHTWLPGAFIRTKTESHFTYSLYNPDTISRFVIDISGLIKQQSCSESNKQWNVFWSLPRQECQVYAYCGASGSCNENSSCDCLTGFQPTSEQNWNR